MQQHSTYVLPAPYAAGGHGSPIQGHSPSRESLSTQHYAAPSYIASSSMEHPSRTSDHFMTGYHHPPNAADSLQHDTSSLNAAIDLGGTHWPASGLLNGQSFSNGGAPSPPETFPGMSASNELNSTSPRQSDQYGWSLSGFDAGATSLIPTGSQDQRPAFDHPQASSVYGQPSESSTREDTPMSDTVSSGNSDLSVVHRSSRSHSVHSISDTPYAGQASTSSSPLLGASLEPASGRAPRARSMRHTRGMSRGSLPEEPEEHETSGDLICEGRKKKREYAKNFRDTEKLYFEELRRRLFPRDPHARRAECLERAIQWIDELPAAKGRELQRTAEINTLRQQLAAAERRANLLEIRLNELLHPSQVTPSSQFETHGPFQPQLWS